MKRSVKDPDRPVVPRKRVTVILPEAQYVFAKQRAKSPLFSSNFSAYIRSLIVQDEERRRVRELAAVA